MALKRDARRRLLCAGALISLLLAAGCTAPTGPDTPTKSNGASSSETNGTNGTNETNETKTPLVVAHRGGADEAAEGALESLLAFAKDGFPVEFDLHPLKDGHWAVAHDNKVDRILKGKTGLVSAMTTQEWKASCIKGPNDSCGTPATWDDVVRLMPPGTRLVPEIKNGEIRVADMVTAFNKADRRGTTTVQTFRLDEAKQLAAAGIRTLYLVDVATKVDTEAVAAAGIRYLGISKNATEALAKRAQASGLQVWVWTVDDRASAQRRRSAGADGLFTDVPKRMRSWLGGYLGGA